MRALGATDVTAREGVDHLGELGGWHQQNYKVSNCV